MIQSIPFTFDVDEEGLIVTAVRPLLPGRELLRVAAGDQPVDDVLLKEFSLAARRADLYPQQGTAGLGDALRVSRGGAQLWICAHDDDLSSRYQARAELSPDGSVTYWHSPIFWGTRGGKQVIMERSVTRAVHQTLVAAAWLQDKASFHGTSDVAVAVLGIKNAVGGTLMQAFHPPRYGAQDYRAHARVTAEEIGAKSAEVTRRLLNPLFEVIAVRGYDPLSDRRL